MPSDDDPVLPVEISQLTGFDTAMGFRLIRATSDQVVLEYDVDELVLEWANREMAELDVAREVVKVFLETSFEDGRHSKRVEKIKAMEQMSLPKSPVSPHGKKQ